jgi:hypothetical protein
MKIALLILVTLIIIFIIIFLEYKQIQPFTNSDTNICTLTSNELLSLFQDKTRSKVFDTLIDKIYILANKLNDINPEKIKLDAASDSITPIARQALQTAFNNSDINTFFETIKLKKPVVNNYNLDIIDKYNKITINCLFNR